MPVTKAATPAPARTWSSTAVAVVPWLLAALLLWLFLAFHYHAVELFDPATADPEASPAVDPGYRRFANALPLWLLSIMLLALTRRPLLSLWLAVLVTGGLYLIDALKFEHLHARLWPADFGLVQQIIEGPGLYLRYLPGGLTASGIILVLLTVALCIEQPQRWLRMPLRLALTGGAIAIGVLVAFDGALHRRWYDPEQLGIQSWVPDQSVQRAGLIASLVEQMPSTIWQLPEPDPAYLAHITATHPAPAGPSPLLPAEAPDIIIWQSESLFDPARLKLAGGDRLLADFERLRRHSLHGDLLVPTFGGATVRTEFEALTGHPMSALPGIRYPYTAVAQRPLMSLPRQLGRLGYHTIAIHPYEAGFWGRNRAYPHLGFDRFDHQDSFGLGDYHGLYIGDDALLRRVVEVLDEPRQQPLFVFAVSMENHGPYGSAQRKLPAKALQAIDVPAELPSDSADRLRSYLYHLRRADRELGRLIDFVDARSRHTIVLFYGDHLPGLHVAFEQLGFRDGHEPFEQPVPFLLYDNRGRQGVAVAAQLHSYHLASMVLDRAGLASTPYFRLLSADRERLSATGLTELRPDPVLDYPHAMAHMTWQMLREDPDQPRRGQPHTVPEAAPSPTRR